MAAKDKKSKTAKKQPQKAPELDIQAAAKLGKVKQFNVLLEKISKGKATAADMKTFASLERELSADDTDSGKSPTSKLSSPEVLKYLGISRRVLSYHVTKGNIRQNPDGTFDLAELDRWGEKYRRDSKRQTSGTAGAQTVGEQKDLADLRYKIARAEREELVAAQLKGSLYNREEVEAALSEMILTTKRAFLLLPHAAPTLLAGKDAVGQLETLQEMVDEIITGLSEQASLKEIERRFK